MFILIASLYIKIKIFCFNFLSNCENITGSSIKRQPILVNGLGRVTFKGKVTIGIRNSPGFYNSYCYLEVRNNNSEITIDDGVHINNNCCMISEGEGIRVGKNVLIGMNFNVYDTDFHDLGIDVRSSGSPKTAPVIIQDNVFIGSNVTILKGVTVGENSVIGSGSIVVKSIPSNVIAGGNPCKILKEMG